MNAITRNANAKYVIPTESEWYKAAYYDPTKGGSNYWLYPMRTDAIPDSATAPGNNAPNAAHTGNFFRSGGAPNTFDDGYAVTGSTVFSNAQNYLTDVGAYTSAGSFYGTFDQGGDLSGWDEGMVSSTLRNLRGGSWVGGEGSLRATDRIGAGPAFEDVAYGFRIAAVPEPVCAGLVALGGWVVWVRRKR